MNFEEMLAQARKEASQNPIDQQHIDYMALGDPHIAFAYRKLGDDLEAKEKFLHSFKLYIEHLQHKAEKDTSARAIHKEHIQALKRLCQDLSTRIMVSSLDESVKEIAKRFKQDSSSVVAGGAKQEQPESKAPVVPRMLTKYEQFERRILESTGYSAMGTEPINMYFGEIPSRDEKEAFIKDLSEYIISISGNQKSSSIEAADAMQHYITGLKKTLEFLKSHLLLEEPSTKAKNTSSSKTLQRRKDDRLTGLTQGQTAKLFLKLQAYKVILPIEEQMLTDTDMAGALYTLTGFGAESMRKVISAARTADDDPHDNGKIIQVLEQIIRSLK